MRQKTEKKSIHLLHNHAHLATHQTEEQAQFSELALLLNKTLTQTALPSQYLQSYWLCLTNTENLRRAGLSTLDASRYRMCWRLACGHSKFLLDMYSDSCGFSRSCMQAGGKRQWIETMWIATFDEVHPRHDICHKHHKQRLCKIISTRVKFQFVNMLLEQLMYVSFFFGNVNHVNQ